MVSDPRSSSRVQLLLPCVMLCWLCLAAGAQECRLAGLPSGGALVFEVTVAGGDPEPRSFWIHNDGDAELVGALACDLPGISLVPDSYTVTPGDSVQVTVSYHATGCGGEELWGSIDPGASCDPVPVEARGDWYYVGVVTPTELLFDVETIGESQTRTFLVDNKGCGDAGLEARFSTGGMEHPEFQLSTTVFSFGTEISVTYTPLDDGDDDVSVIIDVDLSNSGGYWETDQTVVLHASGPPAPVCELEPMELGFVGEWGQMWSEEVVVRNVGGGILSGDILTDEPSCTITPDSYSVAAGDSVIITVTFGLDGGCDRTFGIDFGTACGSVHCDVMVTEPPVVFYSVPDTLRAQVEAFGDSWSGSWLTAENVACGVGELFFTLSDPSVGFELSNNPLGVPPEVVGVVDVIYTPTDAVADTVLVGIQGDGPPSQVVLIGQVLSQHQGPCWFVDPLSGNDLWPGSSEFPYQTIGRAVTAAAPGDTVVMADGVYDEPGDRDIQLGDKHLVVRSQSGQPEECIVDCGGGPGFSYVIDGPAAGVGPTFLDMTITNASVAIRIQGLDAPPYDVADYPVAVLSGLVIAGNENGVVTNCVRMSLRDCQLLEQEDTGLSMPCYGDLEIEQCRFEGNDHGMQYYEYNAGRLVATSLEFVGNRVGAWIGTAISECEFVSCRFEGNEEIGLKMQSDMYGTFLLTDCDFAGNGGHGASIQQYASLDAADCRFTSNGANGLTTGPGYGTIHIEGTEFAHNTGWGMGSLWGAEAGEPRDERVNTMLVHGCGFRNNTSGGMWDCSRDHSIADSEVVDNGGPGLRLMGDPWPGNVSATISTTTVARNKGQGLITDHPTVSLANVIIAANDSAAVVIPEAVDLTITCSDIHGNHTDWTGDLADLLGEDGNICAEPRFCDADNGDYQLAANSPCLGAAGECDRMGALDAGCGDLFIVSGRALDLRGWPLRAVEMTGLPGDPTTAQDGGYRTLVAGGWTGGVQPQFPPASFTPESRNYENVQQDRLDQDFTGAVLGLVSIDTVQTYAAETGHPDSPYLGLLINVEGRVTMNQGTFSDGGGYIQGIEAGINFYSDESLGLTLGDRVCIAGYVWYDSNAEIYMGLPEVQILEPGPPPTATEVPIASLVDGFEWVGSLVSIMGYIEEKGVLEDCGWDYVKLADHDGAQVVVYDHPGTDVDFGSVELGEVFEVQGICTKACNEVRVGPRWAADYLITTDAGEVPGVPVDYALHPCRPNPFNPSTVIWFDLPVTSTVDLEVFDLKGRRVVTLVADEVMPAGRHTVAWHGRDGHDRPVAAGIYLYSLEAEGFKATRRMTLVK